MGKTELLDAKDVLQEKFSIMEENKQLFLQLCQAQEEIEYWFDKYSKLKSSFEHDKSKKATSLFDCKIADSTEEKNVDFFTPLEKTLSENAAMRLKFSELLKTQDWISKILISNSLQARLGKVLIDGVSPQGSILFSLRKLLRIWRASSEIPPALGGKDFSKVIETYTSGKFEAVARLLTLTPSFEVHAKAYTALARYLKSKNMAKEAAIAAKLAYEVDPKSFRMKWLAFKYAEAGEFARADALFSLLPKDTSFSESEQRERQNIILQARQDRFAQIRSSVRSAFQAGRQQCHKLAESERFLSQQLQELKRKLGASKEAEKEALRQRDEQAVLARSYQQHLEAQKKQLAERDAAAERAMQLSNEQAELLRSYQQHLEALKVQLAERNAAAERAMQQRDEQAELVLSCTQELENLRNKLLASETAVKEALHQRDEQIELVRVNSNQLEDVKNKLREREMSEKEAMTQLDKQAELVRIMTQQNNTLEEKLKSAEQRVTLTSKLSILREADIKDLQTRYSNLITEKNNFCAELGNARKILEEVLFLYRQHSEDTCESS